MQSRFLSRSMCSVCSLWTGRFRWVFLGFGSFVSLCVGAWGFIWSISSWSSESIWLFEFSTLLYRPWVDFSQWREVAAHHFACFLCVCFMFDSICFWTDTNTICCRCKVKSSIYRSHLRVFSILQYFHIFLIGFPSLHVVVANSLRRRLIPPYFKHAPRGALRRCTSEIVAVQKLSNPQAYGRSVLGCIEADFVSTKEKH